jgi:hypothetical protein
MENAAWGIGDSPAGKFIKYCLFFGFLGAINLGMLVALYFLGFGLLYPALGCLGFTMSVMIVCAYFQNTAIAWYAKRIEAENIKAISQQSIITNCAFCEKENLVPIRLDEENKYMCNHCNKLNVVHIEAFSAQTAVPLEGANPLLRYTDDREALYAAAKEKLENESGAES